ncbi:unnamed protein product [Brassica rapa]|uniref:LIM zinc-binding domain-containing protein n=3 Tax=Brassica campestris TaxID=3711 RepID=A0A8D9DGQ4_BRACM|nr:unnamed protein product [Brassica rapa]
MKDTGAKKRTGDVSVGEHFDIEVPDTAHQISSDSWFQVAFVLTTGINNAYVLGYSGTVMVPLGWVGGVVGLVLATAISLYANALVAKLHEFGGKRHIRYRDLAGFIYGRKAYCLTWGLQYVNLFMINCGFIILAGSALKAVYVLFRDDHAMKLPHFIAIAGLFCAVFAIGVPHLSALGIWLVVSTIFSLIFIVVAIVLAAKDGVKTHSRDYEIQGTPLSKLFTITAAAANLTFVFNTGMLPEIQATVRQPVVKNMMKALYFQFTVGVLPMLAVTFIGYWAYGSSTSTYLLNSVTGPLWVKALANISAFLQSVICLHIFASPTYEYMDTKFGVTGSTLALKNLTFRIMARGGYLAVSTLLSALLPFLGDFMSFTGAVSTIPLTFILANHMYYKAKDNKLNHMQKLWHWVNVVFFSLMSVAAAIAAVRLISVDSKNFHVFADLRKTKTMSFTGTQQKCRACEKTVYPMELLSADGVPFHKSCFKCSHCKSTLQLSNYSSMEGVLYCKPHFEQLFKETGSFNKNFQSPAKPLTDKPTPELTRTPSRVAGMFSGTQDKCATCSKTVYPIEKVTVESQCYHKSCFKCSHGGCPISPSNYAALEGILYCKHHFAQLFKEKGSYNHLIKSASIKRSAAAAAAADAAVEAVPES